MREPGIVVGKSNQTHQVYRENWNMPVHRLLIKRI